LFPEVAGPEGCHACTDGRALVEGEVACRGCQKQRPEKLANKDRPNNRASHIVPLTRCAKRALAIAVGPPPVPLKHNSFVTPGPRLWQNNVSIRGKPIGHFGIALKSQVDCAFRSLAGRTDREQLWIGLGPENVEHSNRSLEISGFDPVSQCFLQFIRNPVFNLPASRFATVTGAKHPLDHLLTLHSLGAFRFIKPWWSPLNVDVESRGLCTSMIQAEGQWKRAKRCTGPQVDKV